MFENQFGNEGPEVKIPSLPEAIMKDSELGLEELPIAIREAFEHLQVYTESLESV